MYQTKVVPFQRWHIRWLAGKGQAVGGNLEWTTDTLVQLEKQNSWTGVVNGEVVACGGTIEQWQGRHLAWMYLDGDTGKHMLFITREVKKKLAALQGRIELTVRHDFETGHRWARLLGFEIENPPGILRAFGPFGEDHISYVRIR